MNLEQKIIQLDQTDMKHFHFFQTPDSWNSLVQLSDEGWIVKDIIKIGPEVATVILQRPKV